MFGDNTIRSGKKGAAMLRDEPNAYGFITKIYPDSRDCSFYKPASYQRIYRLEIRKLEAKALLNTGKTYLISKLGAGLANRFGIWEQVIEPNIKNDLGHLPNVRFLW